MHSPNDTLVRMANDIGKFFRSQGEEKAVVGIADHVMKFWEPRMKKQIFAVLDEGGTGLDPLPLKALEKLKADMHGMPTVAEAKAAAAAEATAGAPPRAASVEPIQQAKAKAGNGKRARR
jgi:formate dehydrogenase subunit delta